MLSNFYVRFRLAVILLVVSLSLLSEAHFALSTLNNTQGFTNATTEISVIDTPGNKSVASLASPITSNIAPSDEAEGGETSSITLFSDLDSTLDSSSAQKATILSTESASRNVSVVTPTSTGNASFQGQSQISTPSSGPTSISTNASRTKLSGAESPVSISPVAGHRSSESSTVSFSSVQFIGTLIPSSESRPTTESSTPTVPATSDGQTAVSSARSTLTIEKSTDALALITFTTLPSISTSEVPSITTDGHIEITGSDDRPTRVPVLKPHCFFCPPGLKFGIALFGVLPGVYLPGPPPLPGFKLPFPTITIGRNGDPTYSSPTPMRTVSDSSKAEATSIESSSPSECSPTVTSIGSQKMTHIITLADSSTRTSISTWISAIVDCGKNTYSTTTKTFQTSCPSFKALAYKESEDNKIEIMPDGSETLDEKAQRTNGSISLVKRASARDANFVQANPKCLVKAKVRTLIVPDALELSNNDAAQYWFITARSSMAGHEVCGPWSVFKELSPVKDKMKDAFGKPYFYFEGQDRNLMDRNANAYLNVDHAFEIKFLKEFFLEIMNKERDQSDCEKLKEFWNANNPASKGGQSGQKGTFYYMLGGRIGWSRLQTIYNLLPGSWSAFADFIGTDESLNTWKGDLFQTDWLTLENIQTKHLPNANSPSDWIDLLNSMAGGLTLMHHNDVVKAFQTTKNRLYLAFKEIDRIEDPCRVEKYADRFKQYMDTRLIQQKPRIEQLYKDIISSRIMPDRLEGLDRDKYNLLTGLYPPAHFTFHPETMLIWEEENAAQTVKILKRQDSRAICALTSRTASKGSASSSSQTGSTSVSSFGTIKTPSSSSPTGSKSVSSSGTTETPSTPSRTTQTLFSPSRTTQKPSPSPTPTKPTSSQSTTRKPTRAIDTIIFPRPSPAFSPRPGALSPNCRDGLYPSEEDCKGMCEKGECIGSSGSPRFICDYVAPLPPATVPRSSTSFAPRPTFCLRGRVCFPL